jgi:hypothetical protein
MATQPKMMILTSNEDLIGQFYLNKTKDTHVLNLDGLTDLYELICIYFEKKNIKIINIFVCGIPKVIKYINESLIYLIIIN